MSDPFILMCAPNGARRMKADHEALPITPDEIARCAEEIYEAGASIIHLHVRDKKGGHTIDPPFYKPAIEAIRQYLADRLIIQITTEAVGIYTRDAQKAAVKALKPEAVSIALREICESEGQVSDTATFFAWMRAEHIFPQIILYDNQDLSRFMDLRSRGVFATDTPFVLCVLGRHGSKGEDPQDALDNFSGKLSAAKVPWAVCGFGKAEHRLPALAAELGGHVRVGFENNIWRIDGTVAANNAELIDAAKRAAVQQGRALATSDDIRQMFVRHTL